ncbi:MAG: helix-hairpin-helix domain-containing protein [Woeseiaceae bacterium]|nr:helix-hairpin-helix domain-containing protein [Woeseiaceae bacterium]
MKNLSKWLVIAALSLPVPALAGPVDVNSADAETISAELKGIGLSKAQAIVEYRKKYGPFRNADELVLVKGIGERTVELNRADIRVEPVRRK